MNLEEAQSFITNRGQDPEAWEALLAVVDAAVGGHWHDHRHQYHFGPISPSVGDPIVKPGREHTVHTAGYPSRALPLAPEPPEAITGVLRPVDAPEATEGQGDTGKSIWDETPPQRGPGVPSRLRPGRTPPALTADEVLLRIQALCVEVGVTGYSPLSLHEAVEALIARGRAAQQTAERNALLLDEEREAYRACSRGLATSRAESQQWHESASHHRQIAEHYRDALAKIAGGSIIGMCQEAQMALDNLPEWNGRLI